jgi:hypothetical protein
MTIRNELLQEISTNIFDIKENATIAGYGSIGVNGETPMADINATPQTLTGFDVELISAPRGITQDLANNALIMHVKGIWTLSVKVSLTFSELNSSRHIGFIVQNMDNPIASPVKFNYPVGRNTGGSSMILSLPIEVSAASVGDKFSLQVFSDADTFTGVNDIGSTFSMTNNSPITELT